MNMFLKLKIFFNVLKEIILTKERKERILTLINESININFELKDINDFSFKGGGWYIS